MSRLIDRTIETVRKIATELRPPVLDAFGLTAAIEWQATEFQKRHGIRCELIGRWNVSVRDQDLSTAIFRIFQEALTNIARHSGASKVMIEMDQTDGNLLLNRARQWPRNHGRREPRFARPARNPRARADVRRRNQRPRRRRKRHHLTMSMPADTEQRLQNHW